MAAPLALGAALAVNLLALPLASQAATYSYTDLNPSGFTGSVGYGISGNRQIGYGYGPSTTSGNHALLWSGTASSVVDLNPSEDTWSEGFGSSGTQQVGVGSGTATGNDQHALLWSGTGSSVVDLNPSGFTISFALGTSGSQQIGSGVGPATGNNGGHALLWSGTASNVVDLHPSGFTWSEGLGISGGQQVGDGDDHALLWSGTAGSVVDLNPSGFTYSSAAGISGIQQVGYGSGSATGNNHHALLWSGTASSVVDLGSLLSSDYADSYAAGIDENGNVIGAAIYTPTGQWHAMLWTVVHDSVVLCNDPGQCGAVWTYSTGSSVTCSPASGSLFPVGVTTVTCTATNPPAIYTFTITVKDCEPPVVSCRPVHKPSGKGNAKSDKDSEPEEGLDGFYQLLGHDNCDSNPRLYIQDSASGFLAGPFANGDIVKLARKHGRQDSDDAKDSRHVQPPMVARIRLQGNGLLYGVDASGNVGASVLCRTPHGHDD